MDWPSLVSAVRASLIPGNNGDVPPGIVLDGGYAYMPRFGHYSYQSPESGGTGEPVGDGPMLGIDRVELKVVPSERVITEFDMAGNVTGQRRDSYSNPWADVITFVVMAFGVYGVGSALTAGAAAAAGTTAVEGAAVAPADFGYVPDASYGTVDIGSGYGYEFTLDPGAAVDPIWNYASGSGVAVDEAVLFPEIYTSPPASAFQYPIPEVTITQPVASTSGWSGFSIRDVTGAVKELTGAAVAVAQTVRAFQSTGSRVADPTTANRNASAASGLVLTRDANGQVTGSRPPVGVATVTPDGGFIINNGDGTYSVISPTGQMTTRRYGDSAGGGNVVTGAGGMFGGIDPKLLMIGGAALLGVLAMSSRGRRR